MADVAAYLRARAAAVEAALDRLLPAADLEPADLHGAMRYATLGGGKRLRPTVTLAAAEACGAESAPLVEPACAVELIHCYSLIHDDLPAMDDAALRHGKPSCHLAWGEATAILAGDALLALAFDVLARPVPGVAPAQQLAAVGEVAGLAGCRGLVGGQSLDLAGSASTVEALEAMEGRKTGALIQAAARLGGRLAGAGEPQLERLGTYALDLGLAFQITDDVLDVVGDPALLGKEAGADLRHERATFAVLLGVEGARRRARQWSERAVAALDGFGAAADPLRALAAFAAVRDR
jgi:geranylgeranyl pyrophosphate synthase